MGMPYSEFEKLMALAEQLGLNTFGEIASFTKTAGAKNNEEIIAAMEKALAEKQNK